MCNVVWLKEYIELVAGTCEAHSKSSLHCMQSIKPKKSSSVFTTDYSAVTGHNIMQSPSSIVPSYVRLFAGCMHNIICVATAHSAYLHSVVWLTMICTRERC